MLDSGGKHTHQNVSKISRFGPCPSLIGRNSTVYHNDSKHTYITSSLHITFAYSCLHYSCSHLVFPHRMKNNQGDQVPVADWVFWFVCWFFFQSQQWGCVVPCLQTLAGSPLQSLTPACSEFAVTGWTPGWGQEKSCPLQLEPSNGHTLFFQHAEKGREKILFLLLVCMCPLPKMTQVSSLTIALPCTPEQPIQH